jgi:hypothetical protein
MIGFFYLGPYWRISVETTDGDDITDAQIEKEGKKEKSYSLSPRTLFPLGYLMN